MNAHTEDSAFSRRVASLGARVVALDFSESFVKCARRRTMEHAERIDDHVLDAIDEEAVLTLGEARFDTAVCTMALMDKVWRRPPSPILPTPAARSPGITTRRSRRSRSCE